MERGAGSFIKNKEGKLEENLKDPVMKKRKEIREAKEKEIREAKEKEIREKGAGQPEGKAPETKAPAGGGTKKRPADEHEAKTEIIAAMKEVIDTGENLISGGRPKVKAVEAILKYQISEAERNDLMEVFSDVS